MNEEINNILCKISNELNLDSREWEKFKIEIINEMNNYSDIKQKCISIMKDEPLSYPEIVDLLHYCMINDKIKEYMFLTDEGYGVDIYSLINFINTCEYDVKFLKELTKQCRVNDLDLDCEMIFICSNDDDLLFLNNNQFTDMLINQLSDDNLDLSLDIVLKLLYILT